jgi:hypothetical protein
MFLRIGVMHAVRPLLPAVRQPWDESPFLGSIYAYREELYGGIAYTYADELSAFAKEWLEELARVGYRGMITVGVVLTRLHGPIRVKRSGSVKGVEEDGQERQILLA